MLAVPAGMLLPSLALIARSPASLRVPQVAMSTNFGSNPCPKLPLPLSSFERETVTLGMG